jgi:hypothetical protein
MTMAETKLAADDVQPAIEKLKSLRDGDIGVVEAVACGQHAIPALHALLFEREPSGIYQPRCWAARALSILGAYDILFEFLSTPHEARDPVERAGDDAVINAAARQLSVVREERVFQLLLGLARRRNWPGVIAALAAFHRKEAIPYLVGALAEDDCRLLAEPALVSFGRAALPALLRCATLRSPSASVGSETSIRKRRSALSLLMEIGVPRDLWPSLRDLVLDREPRIAVLACEFCFSVAPEAEWSDATHRLIGLLEHADWRLESDVEECLVRHYRKVSHVVAAMLREKAGAREEPAPPRSREVLLRVRARGDPRERRARKGP